MNDYLIDIIMPIYNSKEYLSRALDSIVSQSFKDKIILTIIDDGSEDDYQNILKKYDHEIKINYYKFKHNKGVSKAREYGLKMTNLPYFTFLDSDDYFSQTNAIEILYNAILEKPNYKLVVAKESGEKGDVIAYSHVYGKLYLRKHIQKEKIHFPKDKGYEDACFNFRVFTSLLNEDINYIENIIIKRTQDNPNSLTKIWPRGIRTEETIEYYIKCSKRKLLNNDYLLVLFNDYANYNGRCCFTTANEKIRFLKLVAKLYDKVKKYIEKDLVKDPENNRNTLQLIEEAKKY